MLFGAIERKKCFFDGSLSPIAMKTYAQLLDDWKKADQDSWTKEYGVPWEIMVRYLRYWSLVSYTGSFMLVREHEGPFPKCFKVTCKADERQTICDIVYVLNDEKEDDRIFVVQFRNISRLLVAIRLFADDEKFAAEALPFDESLCYDAVPDDSAEALPFDESLCDDAVPDDSVPTVAKPARACGTGTARAPSTNTSTSSRWPSTPWPSTPWPPQWVWTPHGWYRNW